VAVRTCGATSRFSSGTRAPLIPMELGPSGTADDTDDDGRTGVLSLAAGSVDLGGYDALLEEVGT
jgi:hypothetical protein